MKWRVFLNLLVYACDLTRLLDASCVILMLGCIVNYQSVTEVSFNNISMKYNMYLVLAGNKVQPFTVVYVSNYYVSAYMVKYLDVVHTNYLCYQLSTISTDLILSDHSLYPQGWI